MLNCNNSYNKIQFIHLERLDRLLKIFAQFHGDPHNDYPICQSRHYFPVIYHVYIYMYKHYNKGLLFLISFNVLSGVLNIDSGIKTKQISTFRTRR